MSNKLDSLTDDEVGQITLLVDTLEKSTLDFLQLSVGDLKVTIGKGSVPPVAPTEVSAALSVPIAPSATALAPVAAAPAASSAPPAPAAAPAPTEHPASDPATDGTVAVVAPMMGRFYAKPEPGAAPFVSVGAQVSADSTVGLIEVMKVFTAVRAGVAGVITDICVQDAQFIEYGHVLFLIRSA